MLPTLLATLCAWFHFDVLPWFCSKYLVNYHIHLVRVGNFQVLWRSPRDGQSVCVNSEREADSKNYLFSYCISPFVSSSEICHVCLREGDSQALIVLVGTSQYSVCPTPTHLFWKGVIAAGASFPTLLYLHVDVSLNSIARGNCHKNFSFSLPGMDCNHAGFICYQCYAVPLFTGCW